MAGPEENIAKGWKLLKQHIGVGPSSQTSSYLGCNVNKQKLNLRNGTTVNAVMYDMESFLGQCVEKYLHVAGPDTVLKTAKTPFLQSSGADSIYRRPSSFTEGQCQDCGYCDDESQCTLPESVSETGERIKSTDFEPGHLAPSAASILVKCFYAAQMCRFDLLRVVQGLARYMTR